MSVISSSLLTFGLLLLLHASFSAYEFTQFAKHLTLSSLASSLGVPLDIKIEALLGTFILCLGSVLRVTGTLKPIVFSSAVSNLEAEGKNPFGLLEIRPVFQDIAAKREAYALWKKKTSPISV